MRLLAEIHARGFTGSVKIVRRFLAGLRATTRPDSRLTETPPGEQAQFDWAEVGGRCLLTAAYKTLWRLRRTRTFGPPGWIPAKEGAQWLI